MADVAIFAYGGMLPEEGSTPFGMAFVAKLGGGTGYQHFLSFTAVGIMARDAGDLRVAMLGGEEVGRALQDRLAFLHMTAQAQLLPGQFQELFGDMHLHQSRGHERCLPTRHASGCGRGT